jgi:Spy/CpxP family protein refolding chaperone
MKNQLCRIALSGLLATGLTLGGAAAFAQDNPAPDASAQQPGNGQGRMGRMQMSPDERLAQMTKRYNLSADQQTQIKPILANQQTQMMALRQDNSLSREDKMAKMKGIRDDSNTKIQAILNDSQKAKFAEDQQKMQERMQQRDSGAPAGGPPAQ